jgi:hypothetical protein
VRVSFTMPAGAVAVGYAERTRPESHVRYTKFNLMPGRMSGDATTSPARMKCASRIKIDVSKRNEECSLKIHEYVFKRSIHIYANVERRR